MKLTTSEAIVNSARNLYSDKLHYHNFNHILDVINNAESLLKQCDANNITYDARVICHAILFHDAEYIQNHKEKGFEDKESYSAFLAESVLTELGESRQHVQSVAQAIRCTQMHAVSSATEDHIVRAADLLGLAAPYGQFKGKAIDLYKERELMSGNIISWDEYKYEACTIIRNFVKPRIKLDIELFSPDDYLFGALVKKNIDTLMRDTIN